RAWTRLRAEGRVRRIDPRVRTRDAADRPGARPAHVPRTFARLRRPRGGGARDPRRTAAPRRQRVRAAGRLRVDPHGAGRRGEGARLARDRAGRAIADRAAVPRRPGAAAASWTSAVRGARRESADRAAALRPRITTVPSRTPAPPLPAAAAPNPEPAGTSSPRSSASAPC